MFGNDIIADALLLHGILYAGQLVTATNFASQLTLCQTELNNMLAEWNAQGLAVFSIVKESFLLTANTGDYEIGPDASAPFNVTRPEKIEAWAVYDTSGGSNGGKPVDAATFAKGADDRALSAAMVTMLNYDAAFPDGQIHLYPKPNGGYLELWVWEQFTAISDFAATALLFPPGYLKAIVYNLAVDLAPLFGRQIDPGVQAIANSTKQTLGATNISELTRVPPTLQAQGKI